MLDLSRLGEKLLELPLDERLQRRIIDGERNGLQADLDEALQRRTALEIINDTLGVLLKYQDDIQHVQGAVAQRLLANAANR